MQNLTNLRFADDIVLVRKNIKEIQAMGEELFKLSREAGLLANIQKTKFMNNSSNNNLVIEGQVIERVEEYLGQIISFKEKTEKEINERINKAWKNFWSLKYKYKSEQISPDKKLKC